MDSLTKSLIKDFLPESIGGKEVTALFGGGFKPPTAGHLSAIQKALENHPEIDNIIIYVGGKVRDGITQEQSFKIWDEYYKPLIDKPVRIENSPSPIGDIYRYAKNNPEDTLYWIIGAREGREDDLQDITSRSVSLDKYPNLNLKISSTPDGGMSGTNARRALMDNDKETFISYLPPNSNQDEIWNILSSPSTFLKENVVIDMSKVNKALISGIGREKETDENILAVIDASPQGKVSPSVFLDFYAKFDKYFGEENDDRILDEVGLEYILSTVLELSFEDVQTIINAYETGDKDQEQDHWFETHDNELEREEEWNPAGGEKFDDSKDDLQTVNKYLSKNKRLSEADPKKGTGKKPKGSSRRLYTDENPKDTVKVKFSTRQDIIDTLNKTSFKNKSHARQSQIINLIHQRVRAAYNRAKDPAVKKRLKTALDYAEERKEASKKKTQRLKKENIDPQLQINENGFKIAKKNMDDYKKSNNPTGKKPKDPFGLNMFALELMREDEDAQLSFDTFDYPKYIKSLTIFMLNKGMDLRPLPTVKFINDDNRNAESFFGKTAYYDPNNNKITLYTLNRHPKDVMRSFAHEMIHHFQNLEGRLNTIDTQNTNDEGDLPEIEREAYEKGNMAFRSWTDTLTEGILTDKPEMNEGDTYEKMAAKGKKAGNLKQGTVRKRLKIKDGEKIPLSKINKAISRLKKMKNRSEKNQKYYKALVLAKTLKTTTNVEEAIVGNSIVCDNCGWTWKIADGGNDLYICHKCGHDNTPQLNEGEIEDFAEGRGEGAGTIANNAKEKGGNSMLTYHHFKVKAPYYKKASDGNFNKDEFTEDYKGFLEELYESTKDGMDIEPIAFQELMGKMEVLGELLIENKEIISEEKNSDDSGLKGENIDPKAQAKHKGKSAPFGSAYEKVKESSRFKKGNVGARYRAIEKRGNKFYYIQDDPLGQGIRQEFGPYKTKAAARKKMGTFAPAQNYRDITENKEGITYKVIAKGVVFEPKNITINVGDTVKWVNEEGYHNVNGTTKTYPKNPKGFGNKVGSGWTYKFTFTKPGTYNYQCDPHLSADMVGTVKVKEVLKEGRYDKTTNQISKIVFDKFKEIYDKGDKKGEFILTVGPDDEDIINNQFEFDLMGALEITDGEYFVDGGANSGYDDDGEEITPLLSVKFKIPKNPDWQKVSFDIKDVVRHELEHLTQDGLNVKGGVVSDNPKLARPSKQMSDDKIVRNSIDIGLLPAADYFLLEKEIDAMLQGLYFKAKKSKRPFKDVINDYLNIFINNGKITSEEKEEILNLWRKRNKALSLPIF